MKAIFVLFLLGLCAGAEAQTSKVYALSPSFDSKEAPTTTFLPGLLGGFRQQIIIQESRILSLKKRYLHGVTFRRDTTRSGALRGGTVDLTVEISPGPTTAQATREVFAANQTAKATQVFRGAVLVPSSAAVKPGHKLWGATSTIHIPFATGYFYGGGTVCMDIVGIPHPGKEPAFWWIDCEQDKIGGSATPIGASCAVHKIGKHSTFGDAASLRVGSSSFVDSMAVPGARALIFLSARTLPKSFELTKLGAPGCHQYVHMDMIMAPLPYTSHKGADFAHLSFPFHIPNLPFLMGASVNYQVANFLPSGQAVNSAGLTTSNGVRLSFAAGGPKLGMAVVTSKRITNPKMVPGRGNVSFATAPVMRLTHR